VNGIDRGFGSLNLTTGGYAYTPKVCVLADNKYVVVWASESPNGVYNVYEALYDQWGNVQAGYPKLVNDNIGNGVVQEPEITALPDGGWVVVYESSKYDVSDIFYRHYNSNGVAGAETRVNTGTSYNQAAAKVTTKSDGGWVVTWQSNVTTGDSRHYDIYMREYSANGTPRTASDVKVNTTPRDITTSTFIHETEHVEALADGGWIVIWTNSVNNVSGVYMQRYDANGTRVGGETLVDGSAATATVRDPEIAGLSDGGWVVTWSGNVNGIYHVYQERYDANGNKVLLAGPSALHTLADHSELFVTDDHQDVTGHKDVTIETSDHAAQEKDMQTVSSAEGEHSDHPADGQLSGTEVADLPSQPHADETGQTSVAADAEDHPGQLQLADADLALDFTKLSEGAEATGPNGSEHGDTPPVTNPTAQELIVDPAHSGDIDLGQFSESAPVPSPEQIQPAAALGESPNANADSAYDMPAVSMTHILIDEPNHLVA